MQHLYEMKVSTIQGRPTLVTLSVVFYSFPSLPPEVEDVMSVEHPKQISPFRRIASKGVLK